jgi:hypothetical protein
MVKVTSSSSETTTIRQAPPMSPKKRGRKPAKGPRRGEHVEGECLSCTFYFGQSNFGRGGCARMCPMRWSCRRKSIAWSFLDLLGFNQCRSLLPYLPHRWFLSTLSTYCYLAEGDVLACSFFYLTAVTSAPNISHAFVTTKLFYLEANLNYILINCECNSGQVMDI